jgi:hypothetical protein
MMKVKRLIITGLVMWVLILTVFIALLMLPITQGSPVLQNTVLFVLVAPIALLGAKLYYQSNDQSSGIQVGIALVAVSLIMDAIVTTPFIIIPQGGSYLEFYTSGILWLVVAENIAIVYLYQRFSIRRHADF